VRTRAGDALGPKAWHQNQMGNKWNMIWSVYICQCHNSTIYEKLYLLSIHSLFIWNDIYIIDIYIYTYIIDIYIYKLLSQVPDCSSAFPKKTSRLLDLLLLPSFQGQNLSHILAEMVAEKLRVFNVDVKDVKKKKKSLWINSKLWFIDIDIDITL
jgi:hypothetical protein